ncbi:MAG: DUF378 domain-containing protein [Patescibacteria group bacterium]
MLHKVAFVLLIIGGLNWGLEAFGTGLSQWLPGNVAMIIYILVAISAIIEVFGHKKMCKNCDKPNMQGTM